jgi:hypothetical protein
VNLPQTGARRRAGVVATLLVFALYGTLALVVDPVEARRTPFDPTAAPGFQSDEATYYLMGHSLVKDFDLEYRQEDVQRTRQEFPQGPGGVFLKKGRVNGAPDSDTSRLFFGKSFIYPFFAAPFVKVFGTKGFYVLNAGLMALAFFCAYMFLSARSPVGVSLLLAGGFLFASVVPVYWAWITPELFNYALGLAACFCWLYKFVAPPSSSPKTQWLRGSASDVVAALIIGVLTFSKLTNALLGAPIGLWWLWRGEWRRAAAVAAAFVLSAGLLFGTNTAISGEWNYQGGDRRTCHEAFPFERPGVGLEACAPRQTSEALTNVWFDQEMFWHNLRANARYFVVGRYGGMVAYFFPFTFAVVALLVNGRRRETWQWFVLAGIAVQVLVFFITLPYTFLGGGGSVGNRYFMGVYGVAIFLLPPIQSVIASLVPWLVGGVFMAPLVLSPFDTSVRPGDRAFSGPLRRLPVELTNYLDLPVQTEGLQMQRWFGAMPATVPIPGGKPLHPGFQLLYLDKNSWLQEADGLSFWTRGKSRAELLIRTNNPERRLQLSLTAGPLPTTVDIDVEGHRARLSLAINQTGIVQLAPPQGFPFKNVQGEVSYIWRLSITTDTGFIPPERDGPDDTRFLGVRVLPLIIR